MSIFRLVTLSELVHRRSCVLPIKVFNESADHGGWGGSPRHPPRRHHHRRRAEQRYRDTRREYDRIEMTLPEREGGGGGRRGGGAGRDARGKLIARDARELVTESARGAANRGSRTRNHRARYRRA